MWILSYWVFPTISAFMWLGMLLAMFIRWEVIGHPRYPSMEAGQNIAYISDVGAYGLKPLFITGSVITTVFLDLGFLSERWLRHTGRLAPNTSVAQKVLSILAIIAAIAGSAGLILLSIFDTYHHPNLHDGFLLLFIAGYIISAIFLCAEYQRLGIHYRNHRVLRMSFWVKLAFILVEIVLAAVFIGTTFTHRRNVAAVFEWVIALIFTFYVLSFVIDLLPSVRTKHHVPQGFRAGPMVEKGYTQNRSAAAGHTAAGTANSSDSTRVGSYEYQQPLTTDSAGPNNPNAYPSVGYRGVDGTTAGTTTAPGATTAPPQQKKGFGRIHF